MKKLKNPPNPFQSGAYTYFEGMAPPAKLEVYEDVTRNILSKNDSPDLAFKWSLNPYRGCGHACAYCYARPSHEYLHFGAGTDFETKIVLKKNAANLLRQTFLKPSWKGELIVFSGDTDCYQPLEYHYELTKQCLEVCAEFSNPIALITKSFLVTRDTELLKRLHAKTQASVIISIPFFDEKTARAIEPHAASVAKRFEAVRILSEAGLPVAVNVAPVIPGLNEADIPQILKKARECGAIRAWMTLLRLPGNVKTVFLERLKAAYPLRYEKIVRRIREARDGKLYNSRFGQRMRGTGTYWESIEKIFETYCGKLGFNRNEPQKSKPGFRRPTRQKELAF